MPWSLLANTPFNYRGNHQSQTLLAHPQPTIRTMAEEADYWARLAARGAAASAAAFAAPPPEWGSLPVEQYLLVSEPLFPPSLSPSHHPPA